MPSTGALLKAYGHLLMPKRIDEMTYLEAAERGLPPHDIRQDLMKLYERDCKTIHPTRPDKKE